MRTLTLAAVAFACILLTTAKVDAQHSNSAVWVPSSANSIAIVNSREILESELGKAKKWKTERSNAFRSGAAFFPPNTERMLLASQMDFQFMEPIWNVGVFEINKGSIDIVEVSKRIKGSLDSIGGMDALVLPSDAILVKVNDKTIVSHAPGNRQMTSRWIKSKSGGTANLSEYLSEAVQFADANADMIVAFDLDGVVGKDEIEKRLSAMTIIDQSKLAQYSKSIASLKGITLGVSIGEKISGSIKLDFNADPLGMLTAGKPILIEVLKKNGLMIDDIRKWRVTSNNSKNQIIISGELSEYGFRQIGTLIRQPILADFSSESDSSQVDVATRSKQYFGDIQHVFEELRRKEIKQLSTYAKWFDRYAREIDSLPVRGVDDSLLDYGQYTADSFRDIAVGLRSNNLERAKNTTSQKDDYYAYDRSGRYGSYTTNYSRRNRTIASNMGRMAGENQAKEIFGEVEAATAKIRRDLSKKYNLDF
ncbi:MAG: hypothetical protein P8J27_07525 [Mariniblastus sp.]|nr:hypothetical protein [Mariniblastus sp.]